ncbi:MAG: hypothetical protein IPK39_23980 [Sulfuritalea sp.]|nr:hypothetical protein [Sulfuritalea sp.]
MRDINEFASVLTIGSLILSMCVVTSQLSPAPDTASLVGTAFAETSAPAAAVSIDAPVVPVSRQEEPPVAASCAQCGVVASMREIRQAENASDARGKPGLVRVSLKEAEVEMARRYEVTVRMRDGSRRVFLHAPPANWRAGERLILIGGATHASN